MVSSLTVTLLPPQLDNVMAATAANK